MRKTEGWVETIAAEHQKTVEWAAQLKAVEQLAVERAAQLEAEEQSAAEKAARLIALEEITLQILKATPMTSREMAAFLDREHEQAFSWLRQLQATGKVESTWLKRSPQHPCHQTKDQSSALAVAGEVL